MTKTNIENGGEIEKTLWLAADKLRGNISSSDYKYTVLGLIFLKYISDSFEVRYNEAVNEDFDPEDRDFYAAENVFWVPENARWEYLRDNAKQPNIGVLIDSAMELVEKDNPSLKGVLPKDYAREALDKRRLGELIDLFSTTKFAGADSKDLLGQVYEYFMGMFADSEGKHGGEFYTPRSIVRLLVAMLSPHAGRIYDPCCGSGGMFVQSEEFVESHQGRINDISIYGQELNETTWRLAKMNMAIRGIEADIKRDDTLHNDLMPELKADFIMANPPFNISDWGQELLQNDLRWKFGLPPKGNANYAWIQHIIHHLSPSGFAGFVLANGSMSSQTGGENEIRKAIARADLIDAIVTLPANLFFNVTIPCCLWFISRDRKNRSAKTLFIDARNLGEMITRKSRVLSDEDISKISDVYLKFRKGEIISDELGFAKVASEQEICDNSYILTPGRYVGFKEEEEDKEPFAEKFLRLNLELESQFKKSGELEERIRKNLAKIREGIKEG